MNTPITPELREWIDSQPAPNFSAGFEVHERSTSYDYSDNRPSGGDTPMSRIDPTEPEMQLREIYAGKHRISDAYLNHLDKHHEAACEYVYRLHEQSREIRKNLGRDAESKTAKLLREHRSNLD